MTMKDRWKMWKQQFQLWRRRPHRHKMWQWEEAGFLGIESQTGEPVPFMKGWGSSGRLRGRLRRVWVCLLGDPVVILVKFPRLLWPRRPWLIELDFGSLNAERHWCRTKEEAWAYFVAWRLSRGQ